MPVEPKRARGREPSPDPPDPAAVALRRLVASDDALVAAWAERLLAGDQAEAAPQRDRRRLGPRG
jgi:hypothetical protein